VRRVVLCCGVVCYVGLSLAHFLAGGSTTPTPCGNATVYCPAGSSVPLTISPGYYSSGDTSASSNSSQMVCTYPHMCRMMCVRSVAHTRAFVSECACVVGMNDCRASRWTAPLAAIAAAVFVSCAPSAPTKALFASRYCRTADLVQPVCTVPLAVQRLPYAAMTLCTVLRALVSRWWRAQASIPREYPLQLGRSGWSAPLGPIVQAMVSCMTVQQAPTGTRRVCRCLHAVGSVWMGCCATTAVCLPQGRLVLWATSV
jgi:hypothetical protein